MVALAISFWEWLGIISIVALVVVMVDAVSGFLMLQALLEWFDGD